MNRRATQHASVISPPVKPSVRQRQRFAGPIRSLQQILEPASDVNIPQGLTPGVVRRASLTTVTETAPLPISIENVLAPDDGQVAPPVPQPMNPTEFCREARRVRAVHGNDPVRMHQHLSQMSANGGFGQPEEVIFEEPIFEDPRLRPARAISWTWTQTARLGKSGVSLLSRLGRGFGAESAPLDSADYAIDMEDDQPQYRLEDPDEPPTPDGYPTSVDKTFAALVGRTLSAQPASPLRYSQRLELLKEAGRRGIGRFEANLIIASVQHKLGLSTAIPTPRRSSAPRLPGILAFLLVQSIIVWGLWRVLRT